MLVTEKSRITLVSWLAKKAPFSMLVAGMVTFVNRLLAKASSPMLVTEEGMVTLASIFLLKADLPMLVTEEGMTTLVSL